MGLGVHLLYVLHQWTHGTPRADSLGESLLLDVFASSQFSHRRLVFAFAIEGFSERANTLTVGFKRPPIHGRRCKVFL